jgi:adenosine deaminase
LLVVKLSNTSPRAGALAEVFRFLFSGKKGSRSAGAKARMYICYLCLDPRIREDVGKELLILRSQPEPALDLGCGAGTTKGLAGITVERIEITEEGVWFKPLAQGHTFRYNLSREQSTLQTQTTYPNYPLAELHAHLGTSVAPPILWQIAHDRGIKLPKSEYHEFRDYITLSPERPMALNDYFNQVYHNILDPLSSGTWAVESAVYNTMSGAYRNGIELIELRTNPMKHNFDNEVDLDHLIMAMLRGMERALLEHSKLSAGLIFCIAREYDVERNKIIIEKAIKYHGRGVVGIDIAGPGTPGFDIAQYKDSFEKARAAGLGVTVHSGEALDANDMWEALDNLHPSRIGHGILASRDPQLMQELVKRDVVLEVCPMSNLVTTALADMEALRTTLRTLVENGVKFCINTDWPEVIKNGHLQQQYKVLLDQGIMSDEELRACTRTAFEASFIPGPGLQAYL